MRRAQRTWWVGTHLGWNDGRPDPRALQIGFTGLLLAVMLVRSVGPLRPGLVSAPMLGLVLSVSAAVLVLVVPPSLRRPPLFRVLAAVNIVALGMLAGGPELGGASPLVVLPALWLGLEMGLAGAALAVAVTVLFVSVPGLLVHGASAETVERLALLPVLAGISAFAITIGVTAARHAQTRAEDRESELAAAVGVIEHSRRSAYAIFEAVDIGLTLLDRDGTPILINQRLEQLWRTAHPSGDVSRGWVYAEDGVTRLGIDEMPMTRAQRGEEFDDLRVWIGAEEESRRAVGVSARRVEEEDGTLAGAAVSYTDITDFMRALEVKDEFVALVSHELRTPLTSICGYVSVILERDDLPAQVRKHLETVARNADRLERLVHAILDTVEHSTGLRYERTVVDFAEVVRERVEAAEPVAVDAGVQLTVQGPTLVRVDGDRARLAQVVDNLVSNAVKYTPAGGAAVVQIAIEDGHAVLRVRDTGIGISEDDREHLFTRFYRTREATRLAIQGVGLGLSTVKAIVEGHGGWVGFESDLGLGTEFCVRLPLGRPALVA